MRAKMESEFFTDFTDSYHKTPYRDLKNLLLICSCISETISSNSLRDKDWSQFSTLTKNSNLVEFSDFFSIF